MVEVKFDIPDREVFDRIVADADVVGWGARNVVSHTYHRDLYFDTPDGSLDRRGVRCRVRLGSDDRRVLSLHHREMVGPYPKRELEQLYSSVVSALDHGEILGGDTEPARRLRAFVDPLRLTPVVELETERFMREIRSGVFRRLRCVVVCDAVTMRGEPESDTFYELKIRSDGRGRALRDEVVAAVQKRYELRTVLSPTFDRARKRQETVETGRLREEGQPHRDVTVVAVRDGSVAVLVDGATIALPCAAGGGESACRELMRRCLGPVEGHLRLIGMADTSSDRPPLEVWLADIPSPKGANAHPTGLAGLALAARSGVLPVMTGRESASPDTIPSEPSLAVAPDASTAAGVLVGPRSNTSSSESPPKPDQFINERLSWLEFNGRVLALAEDRTTPLLARLQFLSIFSANLDEFFMVQVGALKQAVADRISHSSRDGLTPDAELDAISVRLGPLLERQQRCLYDECLPLLQRRRVHVRKWTELAEDERGAMTAFFSEQIFPVLTPQAMTQAPGHPFPRLANLSLSLAVTLRDSEGGPVHFAHLRMPAGHPRFVPLPNGTDFIPIEEIVGANAQMLYPDHRVEAAHAFRITRSGDIHFDEVGASSLLDAIEEEVRRRPFQSVVRVEVQRDMPGVMREMLLRELNVEVGDGALTLGDVDVYEAERLVDFGSLKELAGLPYPELGYPRFVGRPLIDPDRSIFDVIRQRDVLVHHPYDSFDSTVQRLIGEAADDRAVQTIKLTLYRSGSESTIVEALERAAARGKDVSVFVELKARFDEERNIRWARALEGAGIHVVTGLVRLKTHAKVALVVRREDNVLRRYAHVGTGNYNAATAKLYTDLGLLTCNDEITADLALLFNVLTGSSAPPGAHFKRLLVAPNQMLDPVRGLIAREAEHARAGRGGRIRVKLNGLADKAVIVALYEASQAGVQIDLIVRGICALRPGVAGFSDNIRVLSILGRFLEHGRIYHFGNGGDDEYYIGSADWRPRNLRRRVEVVTPVDDGDARARLDGILEAEIGDSLAWAMESDGTYVQSQRSGGGGRIGTQEQFIAQAALNR